MVADHGPRSPEGQVLDQIREVAIIPAGQALLAPGERIRALTAKLERIANIAFDREPDEDRGPALIEEVGRRRPRDEGPGAGRRREGPVPIARRRFAQNVERLRRERGHPPDVLAARSGIEPRALAELLAGQRRVELVVIYPLAGSLAMEADRLLDRIDRDPAAAGGSGWVITGGGQGA